MCQSYHRGCDDKPGKVQCIGNTPTVVFRGELIKYVQFVTMFRNNFDNTIVDSSTLFNILERHLAGSAKAAIEPCIFVNPLTNPYEDEFCLNVLATNRLLFRLIKPN